MLLHGNVEQKRAAVCLTKTLPPDAAAAVGTPIPGQACSIPARIPTVHGDVTLVEVPCVQPLYQTLAL